MTQVLHIFRKDVRHFWKEILLSWCILVVYGWQAKLSWNPEKMFSPAFYFAQLGAQFIPLILVLSWWLLLIRVIQDERLVGDRQFWVTRPYRWLELLVAKALFLIIFIHLPLFIAQLVLLKLAGFAALPYLPGLLSMHLRLLTAFFLPVSVIATVTSTLVRVILFAFAIVLYIVGSSWLHTVVPESLIPQADAIPGTIQGVIFLLACLAVVLIQYARRWTLASRGILVIAAVLTLLIEVASPYSALIARAYPSASKPPVTIVRDPTKPEKPAIRPGRPPKPEKETNVVIPLLASPVANSEVVNIQGARIAVELPGGNHWRTKWQANPGTAGIPNSPAALSFAMPTELFDRIKSTPVKIDVEFALSIFQQGEHWQLIAQDGLFPAPRFGLCAAVGEERTMVLCRAPLYSSGPLVAMISSSETTCPVSPERKLTREITSYYWNLSDNSEPAAFINPVVEGMIGFNAVGLTKEEMKDSWKYVSRICTGTPIHFTALTFVRHERMNASLDGVLLSDYKIESYGYGLHASAGYSVLMPR